MPRPTDESTVGRGLQRLKELLGFPLEAVYLTEAQARELESECGFIPEYIGETKIEIASRPILPEQVEQELEQGADSVRSRAPENGAHPTD